MSISTLTTPAKEGSTYAVTIAFTDETGAAVTPSSATWTLTDQGGNVINSRLDVTISSLSTSVTIVLSGNDLALSNSDNTRELLIEAVYTSDLGSNLPFKSAVRFTIDGLLGV